MKLETVNKLFLELSQIATAQTATELNLRAMLGETHDVLRSACEIASRNGDNANWPAFRNVVKTVLAKQQLILYPQKNVTAWVIERDESDGSLPEYYTGNILQRWSNPGDHSSACRFSLRMVAERLALGFDPGRKHRIVEHVWDEGAV
jgi:hypothetical protein